MTAPGDPRDDETGRPGATGDGLDPNDPYRFGLPDTPPPPEYAPPGWTPPGGWPPPPPPGATPQPGLPSPPYGQPGPYPPYPGPSWTPPGGGYQPQGPPPGQPPAPGPYPPHYYGPPDRYTSPARGRAVTAVVFGALSIVFCWTAILDVIPVMVALALGLTSREGDTAPGPARDRTRRLSTAALICAGVGAALAIACTVFALHAINACGGIAQNGQPGFQSCLRHHF